MKHVALLLAVTSAACGSLLNNGPATVSAPPGTAIDGAFGVTQLSKKRSHQVQFADGRTCLITSKVSPLYVLGDVVVWGIVGILVDAVTSDWKTLDAGGCPGVSVD